MGDNIQSVGVINVSSICPDDEIRHYVAALQTFMPEFCAAWGLPHVDVGFMPAGQAVPDGMWVQVIADDSDQAGALGYHEMSRLNYPIGFTFAGTDKKFGQSVSVTLSHELWEMLGDPFIDRTVQAPDGRVFIVENADAVESDDHAIVIPMPTGPPVLLSDFVLPTYFTFGAPSGVPYDYLKKLLQPIPAMLPGGYLAFQMSDGTWGQMTARTTPTARAQARPRVLSRRYRRMFRSWQSSTAV